MLSNLPPVTKALLIANAIAYALQWLLGNGVFAPFMLWPPWKNSMPVRSASPNWAYSQRTLAYSCATQESRPTRS